MVRLEISTILESQTNRSQAYVRASGAGWYFNQFPKVMPSDVAMLSTFYVNRSVIVF